MMRLWIEGELEKRLAIAADDPDSRVSLDQDEAAEVLDALRAAREARWAQRQPDRQSLAAVLLCAAVVVAVAIAGGAR